MNVSPSLAWRTLLAWVVASTLSAVVVAQEPAAGPPAIDQALAKSGYDFLMKYCKRCHGEEQKFPSLDMTDRERLLHPADPKTRPFLVAGKPEESRLWDQVTEGYMPPENQPQPTEEEKALFQKWIAAGAYFPDFERPKREFYGEDTILAIIAADLSRQPDSVRRYTRYFSFVHLWNDPQVSDDMLRVYRAGLSKLVNSLSMQPRIVPPRMVDQQGTILAIDMRDYGWTGGYHWTSILAEYPYGLTRSSVEAENVYRLSECELPYVRGDWFIFKAARPPLYHAMLRIPKTAATLEYDLGVDVRRNFDTDRLWRAAFRKSGVSRSNRMIERHDSKFGAYWKSYDFGTNVDRGDLFRFPLGPAFEGGKYNGAAFAHDGGEIIYNLPNGLQAYMLVKSDDTRIDEGPIAIVSDPANFGGSPAVTNGISCMGCHKFGMIDDKEDTLRANYLAQSGQPVADKVLRLYPEKAAMAQLMARDKKRFLDACEEAIGGFMRTGPDDKRTVMQLLPEPITRASMDYEHDLTIDDVARELGLPLTKPEAMQRNIPFYAAQLETLVGTVDWQRLGLQPLANGETVDRDLWERAYHGAARKLRLGVPLTVSGTP